MNMLLQKTNTIRTHLDLSTSHVTSGDMDIMADEAMADVGKDCPMAVVPVAVYRYGAIMFILHFHDEPEEQAQYLNTVREAGYSEAVVNLIKLAWNLDVDMVRLDQDGEVRDDLTTFEW